MPKPPHADAQPQPHDALFKWTFSQLEHAVGLLKAALPEALVKTIDWTSVRPEKGSYIDQTLRSRHSDLVLSARMGGERVYIYTLIEHQRDVEALMIFRMGLYMMRLWEQLVRDHPEMKMLPPIVPVLLHHSETGWTAATAFQDIVATDDAVRPALLPHIPHFQLRLIDLSGGQASNIAWRALSALGRMTLWCISVAGDDVRFEQEALRGLSAMRGMVQAPNELAALEVFLRYLVATHARLGVEKISKLLVKAAGPKAREAIVTTLDEIEQRGERRGRAEQLLMLLGARFGAVPAEVSAKIRAAKEEALSRWALRVLTAPTLEEVLGEGSGEASTARRPPANKRARRRR